MRLGLGLNDGGIFRASPLRSIISSNVFDLDATLYPSYPGSGTSWVAPANSSYNQTLTGAPTFTGAANTPSAYFAHNGSSYGVLSGANPTFVANWHKNPGGTDFTVAMAFRYIDNASNQIMWGTKITGTSVGIFAFILGADDTVYLTQRGAAAATQGSTIALTGGTDYLAVISHSHANNRSRFWINSTTAVEVAHTFSATTAAANNALSVFGGATGGDVMPNTTRGYAFSAFSEEFTDAKAATLFAAYEARHGRDYTP